MKLYFAPGACSLSPHIVLRESGTQFDLEQVNNQEKKTKSGIDYWTINPKGQVPVLEFDNGERLTEAGVAVLPGTAFGAFGEGYIRISFANSEENLTRALEQIDKANRKLLHK